MTEPETARKARRTRKPEPQLPFAAEPEPPTLRVEYVPLGELARWPRNPKRHDEEGLKSAIRRWGFTLPVVVDERTGRLVAGHGRQEALSAMKAAKEELPKNLRARPDGEWLVPVIRGNSFASEEEAEKYLIADNRFVEAGGWDAEMLSEMLAGFEGPDLRAIGFDESELARIKKLAEQGDEPPGEFVSFTANTVPTEHKCPKCGFKFSDGKK